MQHRTLVRLDSFVALETHIIDVCVPYKPEIFLAIFLPPLCLFLLMIFLFSINNIIITFPYTYRNFSFSTGSLKTKILTTNYVGCPKHDSYTLWDPGTAVADRLMCVSNFTVILALNFRLMSLKFHGKEDYNWDCLACRSRICELTTINDESRTLSRYAMSSEAQHRREFRWAAICNRICTYKHTHYIHMYNMYVKEM